VSFGLDGAFARSRALRLPSWKKSPTAWSAIAWSGKAVMDGFIRQIAFVTGAWAALAVSGQLSRALTTPSPSRNRFRSGTVALEPSPDRRARSSFITCSGSSPRWASVNCFTRLAESLPSSARSAAVVLIASRQRAARGLDVAGRRSSRAGQSVRRRGVVHNRSSVPHAPWYLRRMR
jgi:hypothetical protein